jgi:two-component system, OmpR family, phosphate regulon response regulator PhoB
MPPPTAHILLVEDHADIRRLVRMTLELEPYTITEAASATEALVLAQRSPPDLALLDVMLPAGQSGLRLCGQLRALWPNLPVLMLSALGTDADIQAAKRAGVDAYLLKPFSPLGLIEHVKALLQAQGARA